LKSKLEEDQKRTIERKNQEITEKETLIKQKEDEIKK